MLQSQPKARNALHFQRLDPILISLTMQLYFAQIWQTLISIKSPRAGGRNTCDVIQVMWPLQEPSHFCIPENESCRQPSSSVPVPEEPFAAILFFFQNNEKINSKLLEDIECQGHLFFALNGCHIWFAVNESHTMRVKSTFHSVMKCVLGIKLKKYQKYVLPLIYSGYNLLFFLIGLHDKLSMSFTYSTNFN